jgi:hypothetical protein
MVKNTFRNPIASQWIYEVEGSTTGYLEFDYQTTSEIFIFTRESETVLETTKCCSSGCPRLLLNKGFRPKSQQNKTIRCHSLRTVGVLA